MNIITLELDKTRNLKVNIGTFKQIEQKLKIRTLNMLENFKEMFGIQELIVFFYYGLRWEDPSLTMGDIEKILIDAQEREEDNISIQDLFEIIQQAIMMVFPKAEDKKKLDLMRG